MGDRKKAYNNHPQFYQWFLRNYKNEIQETMFKEKRIASGLRDPPEPFYTNDAESQNYNQALDELQDPRVTPIYFVNENHDD